MIRKNQRPFNFTAPQIARLQQIYRRLRAVNREAICELRRIGCEILSDNQYRRAGKDLRALAIRMDSLMGDRREILAAGQKQRPQIFNLVLTTSCQKCSENGRVPTHNDDENGERASREASSRIRRAKKSSTICSNWHSESMNPNPVSFDGIPP